MSMLGEKIFCRVIGSNVYGADTAYTNVVGPVTSAHIPYNAGGIDAPDVTGTAMDGQTLHCDYGVWSGDLPITYAYQWYQEGTVAPPGDVLTDEFGEPLTDELGEELTV